MKNFFKGLSFSQLFAGALAAVTSFLLSAKIGIAGSVIGVAVGSIVSATASQLYKNVLEESGKRIMGVNSDDDGNADDTENPDNSDKTSDNAADSDDSRTVAMDAVQDGESEDGARKVASGTGDDTDATQTMETATDATSVMPAGSVLRTVGSGNGTSGQNGKQGNGRTGGQHVTMSKRNKRVAIVIAVASALAAVAITAAIILALTGGKGTDTVVSDIIQPSSTPTQTVAPAPENTYGPSSDQESANTPSQDSTTGTDTDGKESGTSGSTTSGDKTGTSGSHQSTDGSTSSDTYSQTGSDSQSGTSQSTDSQDSTGSTSSGTTSGTGTDSSGSTSSGSTDKPQQGATTDQGSGMAGTDSSGAAQRNATRQQSDQTGTAAQ